MPREEYTYEKYNMKCSAPINWHKKDYTDRAGCFYKHIHMNAKIINAKRSHEFKRERRDVQEELEREKERTK